MPMQNVRTVLVLLGLMLSGCATFRAPKYSPSEENVRILKERKVSISAFTVKAPSEKIGCRESSIRLPEGSTLSSYFEEAVAKELHLAGVSGGALIALTISKVDLDSIEGFWLIEGTVNGSTPVKYQKLFPASYWSGELACKTAALTFSEAVQGYLAAVYRALK